MQANAKKTDFILRPYMKSSDYRAVWQLVNTLVPYGLLWVLVAKAAEASIFWVLPISLLLVLFSLRCFSLMHDCGHYALFTSKKANRVAGFVLGVVNAIPQHWWSRDHDFHHKTNGDWERYRSIGDFLSTAEFARLSPSQQRLYGLLRHPLMIFPGGFFYLAFKPRLILLAESTSFCRHVWGNWRSPRQLDLARLLKTYRPTHWSTAGEFWDVLLNNIAVISTWILMCHWLGTGLFLGTYSLVLMLSAAVFISIFFVQHNFEGAYAHCTEGWDYVQGAIAGSSYLDMPRILQWFTADISYHSIHHLSSRIPNYRLRACHERNLHLLTTVKTVRMQDMLACSKLILWDCQANRLVSIDEFQRQPNPVREYASF